MEESESFRAADESGNQSGFGRVGTFWVSNCFTPLSVRETGGVSLKRSTMVPI